MCGIIGAAANRDVAKILLDGLKKLEYRGYDSAGIAIVDSQQQLNRVRTQGKVADLEKEAVVTQLSGHTGIGHTRWATHGMPTKANAHPHIAGGEIALVHNGIIENHELLRERLLAAGCEITSETDSELIAHLVHLQLQQKNDFLSAVRALSHELVGAYALGFIRRNEPGRMIAMRCGSPLVIGLSDNENYISSDILALLPLTHRFIYLEEGDIADIQKNKIAIYTANGESVNRPVHEVNTSSMEIGKGQYPHYMLKEIFEQPSAISRTLQGRCTTKRILAQSFGINAAHIFKQVKRIQIVACGTSYHAGLIGKYWLEELANIPTEVEIASEFRYRKHIIESNTLFLTLSQSGETADTVAALRYAKNANYLATITICNVPESSIVRESQLVLLTDAGSEIGVASTKSFTCQLTALLMLAITIKQEVNYKIDDKSDLIHLITSLPTLVERTLKLHEQIKTTAEKIIHHDNAIFLGRGMEYPIAMEGALKLKEISYIHAEAFPAGELKHGPLALVNANIPIIVIAPENHLMNKLKSNVEEIITRGGKIIIFGDEKSSFTNLANIELIKLPSVHSLIAPIIYAVPVQLLAYYAAAAKGTDVDQPRHLAKSVTVE